MTDGGWRSKGSGRLITRGLVGKAKSGPWRLEGLVLASNGYLSAVRPRWRWDRQWCLVWSGQVKGEGSCNTGSSDAGPGLRLRKVW